MFRGVTDVLGTLAQILPTWAFALLAGVLLAVVLPMWWYSVQVKRIRNRLRKAARAGGDSARAAAVDEAFDLAGRPRLLLSLADNAMKIGLPPAVWQRAIRELEAKGALIEEVARLKTAMEAARPRHAHPLETIARVESLIAHGLHDLAIEHLDEALEVHPGDPDLVQMQETARRARLGEVEVRAVDAPASKPTAMRAPDPD
jgi:hypothetical protein